MSVQAMSWVFEHSSATGRTRLVLLAIANHADKDGRHSWASVRQLGSEAHCSERQVQYSLRELESTGEIVNIGPSTRGTHSYELPAMMTLFGGGAEVAPAEVAPVQTVAPPGAETRRRGVQKRADRGATLAPEPSKNRPKGNRPKERPASPDAVSLCTLLADLIESNGSKRPTVTEAWTTEAERVLRLDHRPFEEAERVLRWSQADSFWRANILSMPTFRRQYDRLRLAATRRTDRREAWADPAGPGMARAKRLGLVKEGT